MESKNLTYGSIVPLIGGESLGISESLGGQNPEWVLSYSDFEANDEHYLNYLRTKRNYKGDYVKLDENPKYKAKKVDIVNTVCPCAGLSSLSQSSSGDSPTNNWMYESAEYVLGNIQPKVFWGENAPRLAPSANPKASLAIKIKALFPVLEFTISKPASGIIHSPSVFALAS